MTLKRWALNLFVRTVLSDSFTTLRRGVGRLLRFGGRRKVLYFHQVDDPYSHLASQILTPLLQRHDVDLEPYLVGGPDIVPDMERLVAWARQDASNVAEPHGLDPFPWTSRAHQPVPSRCRQAQQVLASTLADPVRFSQQAPRVGKALWANEELPAASSSVSREDVKLLLRAGEQKRSNRGHYSSAMFYFEGEWYWGVDRFHYLDERLCDDGALRDGQQRDEPIVPALNVNPVLPKKTQSTAVTTTNIRIEYFLSLRSPYSAISTQRTLALPKRYPQVKMVLKPVLPMVMRGFAVPFSKKYYIVTDTKREADRLGLPFGDIYDPIGDPIERAFSLYPWVEQQGKAGDYLSAYLTGVYGTGIDTSTEEGLKEVVESVGLSWQGAQDHLDKDNGWREQLEQNRTELLGAGLWGVPCFRVCSDNEADFSVWGQDRLWLVEQEIQKRLTTG